MNAIIDIAKLGLMLQTEFFNVIPYFQSQGKNEKPGFLFKI